MKSFDFNKMDILSNIYQTIGSDMEHASKNAHYCIYPRFDKKQNKNITDEDFVLAHCTAW